MRKDISGIILEKWGWERKGSTFTKGNYKIVYDGCHWLLNGNRIDFADEIPII